MRLVERRQRSHPDLGPRLAKVMPPCRDVLLCLSVGAVGGLGGLAAARVEPAAIDVDDQIGESSLLEHPPVVRLSPQQATPGRDGFIDWSSGRFRVSQDEPTAGTKHTEHLRWARRCTNGDGG